MTEFSKIKCCVWLFFFCAHNWIEHLRMKQCFHRDLHRIQVDFVSILGIHFLTLYRTFSYDVVIRTYEIQPFFFILFIRFDFQSKQAHQHWMMCVLRVCESEVNLLHFCFRWTMTFNRNHNQNHGTEYFSIFHDATIHQSYSTRYHVFSLFDGNLTNFRHVKQTEDAKWHKLHIFRS